ncbi:hypothetical protein ACA910_008574 [Epithemia clementina (nom. ined.)]
MIIYLPIPNEENTTGKDDDRMANDDGDPGEDPLNPSCPICMHESIDFVCGPCRHEFCLPCVERLLLSPRAGVTNGRGLVGGGSSSNGMVATPTLGLCPICRQELYLFDLCHARTGEKVHQQNFVLPEELAGAIFVESTEHYQGMIGRGSYHFPIGSVAGGSSDNNNNGSHSSTAVPPYYDMSKVSQKSDPTGSSDIVPFVDCHWHEKSRTFAGILRFPNSELFDHHQVILSFSPNWRFVRQGVVILRRRKDYKTTKEIQLAYPFDGEWKVVRSVGAILADAFPDHKKFTVQGFGVVESMTNYPCIIRPRHKRDPPGKPTIVFSATMKEFVSLPYDLDLQTESIPIGYEWTWVDPADPEIRMTWIRESISTSVPSDQASSIGGNSGRLLIRSTENENDPYLNSQRQRVAPEYNRNNLWGNVFCQALQVGLASYHFEGNEEGDVYISYESPSTGMWPPLDNGQAVPARVPFRNISFDPESRTFRGHICWQEEYGTSWQGMIRWEYEMVFDRDYTCIVSGHVDSVNSHGIQECMSRYGESLVYCNAKLWEVFRNAPLPNEALPLFSSSSSSNNNEEQQQTQLPEDAAAGERYRARSAQLRQDLQSQGASVRTVALVHRILTAAQDPQGQNPIEYIV